MDASARIRRPIDLAHTPPFQIGQVKVLPASREVLGGGRREVLEPLVMQVLVALQSAHGETLSRNDLIDACWGGRAVTDDAVNRVITRLRALGRSFGGFQVETITKVGYRLVGPDLEMTGSATGTGRRQLIFASGAAAALGLLGFSAWRLADRSDVPPQAQLLIQKGLDALQHNDSFDTQDPGSTLEATALLTDATRAAPTSATAWGGLAMAYAVRKRTALLSDRPGLDARSRAAAKTALELDPAEPRALGALRLLEPVYRNWIGVERADRQALGKNPKLPILLFVMSDMLGSVGRWKEAAQFSKQFDRKRFLIAGADRKLLIDLWASGDLQGADNQLELAVRQWPQHPQIWRSRLTYLMYSGRPEEALSILRDPTDRPPEIPLEWFEAVRMTAEALSGRRSSADAVNHNLRYLEAHPSAALQVAQACVALGDSSTMFELLNGYYFGENRWARLAPQGGDQDRITNPLFHPIMGSVWHQSAFERLLRRIGLEDYWRRTGTMPDFRRGA